MNPVIVVAGATTYLICGCEVPDVEDLPWGSGDCDAFVVIRNPRVLTNEVAAKLSKLLVGLRTDWVEVMGPRSEYLHDRIDKASVDAGRQARIGDGSPMTAWYDDMNDVDHIFEYVRTGGPGATDNKLIVVVAEDDEATTIAEKGRRALEYKMN